MGLLVEEEEGEDEVIVVVMAVAARADLESIQEAVVVGARMLESQMEVDFLMKDLLQIIILVPLVVVEGGEQQWAGDYYLVASLVVAEAVEGSIHQVLGVEVVVEVGAVVISTT